MNAEVTKTTWMSQPAFKRLGASKLQVDPWLIKVPLVGEFV